MPYNDSDFVIQSAPNAQDAEGVPLRFTLKQRIALTAITWAATLFIRLLGPTLRYEFSVEPGGPPEGKFHPTIFAFWHRCIIPACYAFRGMNIAVMTSSSFDGEYIARIIQKFGYRPIRGSSTRGGVRALREMHQEIKEGRSTAFTIDGPLGPVFVAKPGPVLLARNTQAPIAAFYMAVERAWVLNSWDRLMIPKPFSRVNVQVSSYIRVPVDAEKCELDELHALMQAALERVQSRAQAIFPAG